MFIEEQELEDWNITPNMSFAERKQKSIEAYWLDKWYDKMKSITFPTYLYYSENDIPDILPFEKSMVRYENKSPKDSEFWTHISTKQELINLFYTSLRCKTNPGKIYCVRQWIDLKDEYRCFWNGSLVAISSESDLEPPIDKIIEYIKKISSLICYNRCVFDIAHLVETNELIFIEYNSWESNSGGHRFNWLDDTDILYSSNNCITTIRWANGEKIIPLISNTNVNTNANANANAITINTITNFDNYVILKPLKPSNWLVTEKHIYVTNDIWLGRFTLDMKPINWVRGIFRFNTLQLCDDGCIYAEPNFYYYDLTPKKQKSRLVKSVDLTDLADSTNLVITNSNKYKYGFNAINKSDDEKKIIWIRILDNCQFFET